MFLVSAVVSGGVRRRVLLKWRGTKFRVHLANPGAAGAPSGTDGWSTDSLARSQEIRYPRKRNVKRRRECQISAHCSLLPLALRDMCDVLVQLCLGTGRAAGSRVGCLPFATLIQFISLLLCALYLRFYLLPRGVTPSLTHPVYIHIPLPSSILPSVPPLLLPRRRPYSMVETPLSRLSTRARRRRRSIKLNNGVSSPTSHTFPRMNLIFTEDKLRGRFPQ